MFLTLYGPEGDSIVFRAPVQKAEQVARGKQAHGGLGDLLLRDKALLISNEHVLVGIPAVEVAAHAEGKGRGLGGRTGDHVARVEIADCPAVGDHMALKPPSAAQRIHQQVPAATAGFAVGAVIGAHNGFDPGFPDQIFKGGKIGFLQIFRACLGIEAVPQVFRTAVHREMLGAGGRLHGRAAALQPAHVGLPEAGGQIRVFPIGLVPAAPARVAEDVDVRGPEGQPVVDIPVFACRDCVVLGAALGGRNIAELFEQGVVKHGCQTDGLREAGGGAAARHAVQGFVPPVVGRNTQTLDGGRVIAQLACFLLQRHPGHQGLRLFSCFFTIHSCEPPWEWGDSRL